MKTIENKMHDLRDQWRAFNCYENGDCAMTPDETYEYAFNNGYEAAKSEYEAKLKAAVEVIEFYANKENWQWSAFNYFHAIYKEDSDDVNCEDDHRFLYKTRSIGGKKAREFLKSQNEITK